ncbi:MAG: bifunctional oligoribonuclease/PAP phosphatase NrnA [Acholeplasmatales bacterium]|nr:bifunctional oligoribonuclease/PAP phosphatase NrnA [Acholeplasmatales bacterium]
MDNKKKTFKKILKAIRDHETILIHGHVRPDGDCIGSQIGLKNLILANFPEKKVKVVGDVCEYCKFVGVPDGAEDEEYRGALSIVVDCGNAERISDQRYKFGDTLVKIDHHVEDTPYGDISYVEDSAGSCTQIITDFARQMKLMMTLDAAYPLYVGMVTDTGRFRFDSVTSTTFEDAAYLLSCGVNIEDVDNHLSVTTLKTLKLQGYVLSNFKATDNGYAYICMTQDIVKEYGVTNEEAANQVSTLAGIEGYPVWGLFMEYPDEIRIRIRSRGPEIKTLANKYNGGGHEKAAGAHLDNWEQLPDFLNDVDQLVKQYKDSLVKED